MKDLLSLFQKMPKLVTSVRAVTFPSHIRTPIAPQDLIPLSVLTAATHPFSDRVHIFYDESERLVRFLAATDKPAFLALLDALARHQPFESALPRSYPGKFANTASLEEKFRDYACKDFGTSLQQASNG